MRSHPNVSGSDREVGGREDIGGLRSYSSYFLNFQDLLSPRGGEAGSHLEISC